MYRLSKAEQETTIRWDAEEQVAHIHTATPATIRKLDKLTAEFPEVYRCTWTDDKYLAKAYTVPMKYVRFAKPPTEAQREAGRTKAARMISRRRIHNSVGILSTPAPSDEEIPVQTSGAAGIAVPACLTAE